MSMKESSAYRSNTCVALLQDDSSVCFLLSLTSLCSPGDHTAALSLCSKNPLKQPPLFSLSADFFSCSKNLRSSGCLSLTVLSFSTQFFLSPLNSSYLLPQALISAQQPPDSSHKENPTDSPHALLAILLPKLSSYLSVTRPPENISSVLTKTLLQIFPKPFSEYSS